MSTRTRRAWPVILAATTSLAAVGADRGCSPSAVGGHEATADCWACHGDRYEAATDPDHAAGGYPKDCSGCHATTSWEATVPDAHAAGGPFPLEGKHATAGCVACHEGGFAKLPADCASCHADDYAGTTDPDHEAQGFPRTCRDCHGFDGWSPASGGPHGPADRFPLIGGHAGRACADCHQDGYASVPRTCDGCHAGDYDGSTNPAHGRLSLPRACDQCHVTTGWTGADLGSYHGFPLTTGRHSGYPCADCHLAGRPWADFSCIDCHEHDRTEMDDQHLGEVPDYQWASAACVRCHPNGDGEDAE